MVQKWPAVKFGRMKKVSLSKEVLTKTDFVYVLSNLTAGLFEPVEVQRHNIPHFKGLISG